MNEQEQQFLSLVEVVDVAILIFPRRKMMKITWLLPKDATK